VDQGNFVAILNADKIIVSGKKENEKLYYRPTQRPGSLKIETFKQLQARVPSRILEKSIWGMLPKGALGRQYYKRLFIYSDNKLNYLNSNNQENNNSNKNWIKIEI
jgi:large subunit ribosomal protein L13